LPVNTIVEGTVSHGSPDNVDDQRACVKVDRGTTICEPNYVGGLGNVSSRNYSITVPIHSDGPHMLKAFTAYSRGDHNGVSFLITIYVVFSNSECDEKDPPAYANEYLNCLNLPSPYVGYRGTNYQVIAINHSNGAHGACQYNSDAVCEDVEALLVQFGL
jgi:hypothetical protein